MSKDTTILRQTLRQHLNRLFARKDAPNGCEQCGKIYEAIGDPDGEYNVGRCGNPCQECAQGAPLTGGPQ